MLKNTGHFTVGQREGAERRSIDKGKLTAADDIALHHNLIGTDELRNINHCRSTGTDRDSLRSLCPVAERDLTGRSDVNRVINVKNACDCLAIGKILRKHRVLQNGLHIGIRGNILLTVNLGELFRCERTHGKSSYCRLRCHRTFHEAAEHCHTGIVDSDGSTGSNLVGGKGTGHSQGTGREFLSRQSGTSRHFRATGSGDRQSANGGIALDLKLADRQGISVYNADRRSITSQLESAFNRHPPDGIDTDKNITAVAADYHCAGSSGQRQSLNLRIELQGCNADGLRAHSSRCRLGIVRRRCHRHGIVGKRHTNTGELIKSNISGLCRIPVFRNDRHVTEDNTGVCIVSLLDFCKRQFLRIRHRHRATIRRNAGRSRAPGHIARCSLLKEISRCGFQFARRQGKGAGRTKRQIPVNSQRTAGNSGLT